MEKINDITQKLKTITLSQVKVDQKKVAISNKKITKEKTQLEKELEAIKNNFNTQTAVNNLFETPAVTEDTFNDKIAIKSDTNSNTINTLKESLPKKTPWDNLMIQALDNGLGQVSSVAKANQAVVSLIDKNNTVAENVTRSVYDAAQKLVTSLNDGSTKKDLTEKLAIVLKVVEQTEKSAQEQAVKTARKAQEAVTEKTETPGTIAESSAQSPSDNNNSEENTVTKEDNDSYNEPSYSTPQEAPANNGSTQEAPSQSTPQYNPPQLGVESPDDPNYPDDMKDSNIAEDGDGSGWMLIS